MLLRMADPLDEGPSDDRQLVVRPRIQKDKWSLYWKESMETKTEPLEELRIAVDRQQKVSDVFELVRKHFGWAPVKELSRLEGFSSPWDTAVYRGRTVEEDAVLEECLVPPGAALIVVRRVLVPEGWKIINEDDEDDFSSSDEDW